MRPRVPVPGRVGDGKAAAKRLSANEIPSKRPSANGIPTGASFAKRKSVRSLEAGP